jgi:hypothetical protein
MVAQTISENHFLKEYMMAVRFWILDFGFGIFCDFNLKLETENLKLEI